VAGLRAWFGLVFPALTLNYLGQSALILHHPGTLSNPFFLLLPPGLRIPMVFLATIATVIASQAVISGAYSVSLQAVRLGYLPRLTIRHTSEREIGQIYVPAVNAALFVAVVVLVLKFGSSARLAAAYGIAVSGTFLITSALFLTVARQRWRWPAAAIVLCALVVGPVEIAFFGANLAKIVHGGFLPLLIAAAVFTVMTTWHRGREIVSANHRARRGRCGRSWSAFTPRGRRSGACRARRCSPAPRWTRRRWPCAPMWSTTACCTSA
jgi:KUP system potassium uptake protein